VLNLGSLREGLVVDIKGFPDHFLGFLTPSSKVLFETIKSEPVLYFVRDKNGFMWPTTKNDAKAKESSDGLIEFHVRHFCKQVFVEKGKIPLWALRKTAAVINTLVSNQMIYWGLHEAPTLKYYTDEEGRDLAVISLKVFSACKNSELNSFLRNTAFIPSRVSLSEISYDWATLPEWTTKRALSEKHGGVVKIGRASCNYSNWRPVLIEDAPICSGDGSYEPCADINICLTKSRMNPKEKRH
jgi:hypothetical protein